MKSLANVVTALLLSSIFSGPIAFAITFLKTSTKYGKLTRRSAVILFALWGILTSGQFLLANIPTIARGIGLLGILTALIALKREFIRQQNHQ